MQRLNKKTITKPVGALSVRNTHEEDPIAPSKNHRGITLIALIITIIVMIILVGVTISVALNGGLFETTRQAAKGTDKARIEEQITSVVLGHMTDKLLEDADISKLKENLMEIDGIEEVTGDSFPINIKDKYGNEWTIDDDGILEEKVPEVEKVITEEDEEYTYWKTDGQGTIIYYDIPEGVEIPETLIVPCQIGDEKIRKIGDFALCGLRVQRNEDGSLILGSSGYPTILDKMGEDEMPIPTAPISKVKDIIISKGIEETGNYSICYNYILETIDVPSTVKSLGEYFVAFDSGLKTVNIREGLEIIGPNAFSECTMLEKIIIPNSLITIGDDAFFNCTSIKEITIPEGVDNMGEYAFSNWTAEQTIYMKKSEEPPLESSMVYSGPGWLFRWRDGCNANVIWNS